MHEKYSFVQSFYAALYDEACSTAGGTAAYGLPENFDGRNSHRVEIAHEIFHNFKYLTACNAYCSRCKQYACIVSISHEWGVGPAEYISGAANIRHLVYGAVIVVRFRLRVTIQQPYRKQRSTFRSGQTGARVINY